MWLAPLSADEGTSAFPILNCHIMSMGPACLASLPLLPVTLGLLLYILSYRTSVQLVQVVLSDGFYII